MANENNLASGFRPSDLCPEAASYSGGPYAAPYGNIPVGLGKGVGLAKQGTQGVIAPFRVPEAAALGTGFTVELLLADDVVYPGAGLNAYIGVSIGPITSGTSTLDENATTGPLVSTTEVKTAITMPATAGVLKVQSFALPNADLNSLAAGGWAMLRVRRISGNALDTHTGRVVLLGADVRNT